MAITAGLVKELREKTGVGMMECKKALEENAGDMDKAVVWLRERGLARASSKSGRAAAEGLVIDSVSSDKTSAVLIELNCETDFVTKNDDFVQFGQRIAKLALEKKTRSVEELKSLPFEGGATVGEFLTSLIARIGENMNIRRLATLSTSNGTIVSYNHMGGKIGALVTLAGAKGPQADELGKDVAMHIAASAPRYLEPSEVAASEIEQEREIARKKLLEEGKPANMVDKILEGQITKFYKEVCLLEQPFVKDPKVSVSKHVATVIKDATVAAFVRFQLGDGVEKKQEDFAAEVAAQLKK
jgi:elongation factor Ts